MNIIKRILLYSIRIYLILSVLFSVLAIPFALLFNDSNENPFMLLVLIPQIFSGILPWLIPIIIVVALVVMFKDACEHNKQKDLIKKHLVRFIILFSIIITGIFVFYYGEGKFIDTGYMKFARRNYSATLLKDGNVLITGGCLSNKNSKSSEIYDVNSGKFFPSGEMNYQRDNNSAILLKNGNVLVLGGTAKTKHAEIYDVNTKKFYLTGSMIADDSYYSSAILLKDGRVFVVEDIRDDKDDNYNPKTTCEIYDPRTGKFNFVGKTHLYHYSHTTTLLPNGKVLITGGVKLQNAELYDPIKNVFTLTGKPEQVFGNSIAILLNNNKVLLAGHSKADLYDISKGTFVKSKDHIKGNYCNEEPGLASLLNNGRVLLLPVRNDYGSKQALYDSQKDKFTYTKRVWFNYINGTATTLKNGNVLVTGGYKGRPLLYKY